MDKKALDGLTKLRASLVKEYGAAVTRQDHEPVEYEVISTGSPGLDFATVVGGYVKGRIHLLWGPEGAGKTTAAIIAMAEAQRNEPDKAVCYIDMEQTFDWRWARQLGLDTSEDRLIHLYPESSEDVSDMLKKNANSGFVSMVVVDSVGGMVTKKASEKDADESDMGKNAQVVTRMCQVTAVVARRNKVVVLIVSQVRANFASPTGGDTYAAPKALRHSTTMVIKFRKNDAPLMVKPVGEDEKIPVGQPIAVKVERSKVAPGGRTTQWVIINVETEEFGPVGLNAADEALTLALKPSIGVIQQRGGWYDLPDGTSVNGREKVLVRLRSEPDLLRLVRNRAIESVRAMVQEEKSELVFVPGVDDTVEDVPEPEEMEAVNA